jgi:hypothetical protein
MARSVLSSERNNWNNFRYILPNKNGKRIYKVIEERSRHFDLSGSLIEPSHSLIPLFLISFLCNRTSGRASLAAKMSK